MQFKANVKKTDYDDPAIFDTVEHIQNQINEAGIKIYCLYFDLFLNIFIEQTASKILFKWKTVPISFPPSIIENALFNNDQLFKFPTFNELDELAIDNEGRTKRLNKAQLEAIKKEGYAFFKVYNQGITCSKYILI